VKEMRIRQSFVPDNKMWLLRRFIRACIVVSISIAVGLIYIVYLG